MSHASKVLIWDLPTRLFHWLLTVGFLTSFGIAQFAGEHSSWFPVHMIVGVALGVVALLRVVWGFEGSRYARFAYFLYRPTVHVAYMRDAVVAKTSRYSGQGTAHGRWQRSRRRGARSGGLRTGGRGRDSYCWRALAFMATQRESDAHHGGSSGGRLARRRDPLNPAAFCRSLCGSAYGHDDRVIPKLRSRSRTDYVTLRQYGHSTWRSGGLMAIDEARSSREGIAVHAVRLQYAAMGRTVRCS
jgi:hypothetical protein